ncbi:MAG: hypothetical protein D6780_00660 [Candidatus Dadabacteria bacterium]|nr:MAG: hypothetical protein D6780_00660 [Candidatus Dadabacteria bacterium]
MKVTLDLDRLLAEGKISQSEYDRLLRFSARDTGSLAFNLLVASGVIAVSCGLLAILPSPYTAITVGLVTSAFGIALGFVNPKRWKILSVVSTLTGALLLGGGIISIGEGSPASFVIVAAIYVLAGCAARSGLLVSLAILALASSLGARTGYQHAMYFLGINKPGATVMVFFFMAIFLYQLSKVLPYEFKRLAIIASRTSVFVVNFGFWIGSLWGDRWGTLALPRGLFAIGWAVALLATGIWAVFRNKRWVVNTIAAFGGIHFYTQWFERLGATPVSVVGAGLCAIIAAVGLRSLNKRMLQ